MRTPKKGDATFIRTFLGGYFWPLDPRADEIFVEDIAHSLANSCRWTGHVRKFYSVAQHSVLAANYVPPELALQALLHDASEAYLVDLSRPIKHAPGLGTVYRKVESKLEKVIFEKFGLPKEIAPEIKLVDNMLLWTEKRDLVAGEWEEKLAGEKGEFKEKIVPWSPEEAEHRFLQRYSELTGAEKVLTPFSAIFRISESPARTAGAITSAPSRPPNSFTHAEYVKENGVSSSSATAQIAKLRERGVVKPVRFSVVRSDGQKQTVGGWQLVDAPIDSGAKNI